MNVKNLLEEIDIKKRQMIENVQLHETKALVDFYVMDFLSILLVVYVSFMFFNDHQVFLIVVSILSFLGFMPSILLRELFPKKNLSFSYHLMSIFKKEKIKKICLSEKIKVVSKKQIDKDFLMKISLHMEKSEFKHFLNKCNGNITIEKLEEMILLNNKEEKRINNIEELTNIIYEENKHLILESKKV